MLTLQNLLKLHIIRTKSHKTSRLLALKLSLSAVLVTVFHSPNTSSTHNLAGWLGLHNPRNLFRFSRRIRPSIRKSWFRPRRYKRQEIDPGLWSQYLLRRYVTDPNEQVFAVRGLLKSGCWIINGFPCGLGLSGLSCRGCRLRLRVWRGWCCFEAYFRDQASYNQGRSATLSHLISDVLSKISLRCSRGFYLGNRKREKRRA